MGEKDRRDWRVLVDTRWAMMLVWLELEYDLYQMEAWTELETERGIEASLKQLIDLKTLVGIEEGC